MKYGKLAALVMVFCLFWPLAAPLEASAGEVIELKAAVWFPPMHPVVQQVFLPWGKMIEERTKGRVKIKWFLGGTLVRGEQGLSAVKSGLADIVLPLNVWAFSKQFPATTSIFMPFQLNSEIHAAQSYYECFQQIPAIRNEYADMKVIGFFSSGITNFHMKTVLIKDLAGFKDQKIWAGNNIGVTSLKIWKASPRIVKLADIYMSLQRGALDGIMFPTPPLHSFKFTDLVNKHTICAFMPGAQIGAMNKKRWDSLPPDIQKVFEDLTLSLGIAAGTKFTEMNKLILGQLKKRGDQMYFVPPKQRDKWRATLNSVYETQIADLNKAGLDGKAMFGKVQSIVDEAAKHPMKRDSIWKPLGR
ncbi:MAG: TRAP transporter substrate-binding protein DctP [Proteobacteria bacterium]|nr:TRAP transporter substrate-binding protein DctP [Pseudomonadota bacterium]MBU2468241.1 TRAP transporter substrate-binding protein DctP [Pseudomonadota bacterium]MBU2518169.1 TRAP transporter substrate-binding protein DctP [Pseudomonadota bacterium]